MGEGGGKHVSWINGLRHEDIKSIPTMIHDMEAPVGMAGPLSVEPPMMKNVIGIVMNDDGV